MIKSRRLLHSDLLTISISSLGEYHLPHLIIASLPVIRRTFISM